MEVQNRLARFRLVPHGLAWTLGAMFPVPQLHLQSFPSLSVPQHLPLLSILKKFFAGDSSQIGLLLKSENAC